MEIIRMPLGALQTNCYIISTENKNAIVIDPGYDANFIFDRINKEGLNLKIILLTHGHYDHTGALFDLKDRTNAKIYIHKDDEELLGDNSKNLSSVFGGEDLNYKNAIADVILNDNDKVSLDNICFKVMHTPGHTNGGVIYIEESEKIMFTGDTIFKGYIGRSDLYGGNSNKLIDSIKKIANIADGYTIYGGHEEHTTFEYEKNTNSYLQSILSRY